MTQGKREKITADGSSGRMSGLAVVKVELQ